MTMDFSQLKPEQRAKLDKALEFLELAKMPWSKEGARNRAEIEKQGGLNPDDARVAAAYRAYKYGIEYRPLDPRVLVKHGIPQADIPRLEAERRANHEQETLGAFDVFVKPQNEQTIEPLEITASPKARKPRGASAAPAPVMAPPAAPIAPIPAPAPPTAFDASVPGPPPMQAGTPRSLEGDA